MLLALVMVWMVHLRHTTWATGVLELVGPCTTNRVRKTLVHFGSQLDPGFTKVHNWSICCWNCYSRHWCLLPHERQSGRPHVPEICPWVRERRVSQLMSSDSSRARSLARSPASADGLDQREGVGMAEWLHAIDEVCRVPSRIEEQDRPLHPRQG